MNIDKQKIKDKIEEELPKNYSPIFKSKYFWIIAVFFIWMSIFDSNSFYKEYKYNKEINQLTEEIAHYQEELENNKLKSNQLKSSKENLEKFAREQYYMKKDNEDIFIVE